MSLVAVRFSTAGVADCVPLALSVTRFSICFSDSRRIVERSGMMMQLSEALLSLFMSWSVLALALTCLLLWSNGSLPRLYNSEIEYLCLRQPRTNNTVKPRRFSNAFEYGVFQLPRKTVQTTAQASLLTTYNVVLQTWW